MHVLDFGVYEKELDLIYRGSIENKNGRVVQCHMMEHAFPLIKYNYIRSSSYVPEVLREGDVALGPDSDMYSRIFNESMRISERYPDYLQERIIRFTVQFMLEQCLGRISNGIEVVFRPSVGHPG